MLMSSLSEQMSVDIAAQCFLNALMRETNDWQLRHAADGSAGSQLVIPLDERRRIEIALRYVSPTQHHHYHFPARLCRDDDSTGQPLDFAALTTLLLEKPGVAGELAPAVITRFNQRVQESHRNTWQAIAARPDWSRLRDRPLNFGEAEQALLAGHAFHPAPKSHEPFSDAEARRYLPEFASAFPLRWFAIAREQLAGESLNLTLPQRLIRLVSESAPALLTHLDDDTALLPMHPWQASHLLKQPWCQRLMASGKLRDLGEAGESWLPTSSSRAIYFAHGSDMLKFSLSVRLTNSLRTLSVKEVKRGMRLARLATTREWQGLQLRHPTLRVMQEDGWAGIKDEHGVVQEESLLAFRVNLLKAQPEAQTNVLVSLTQAAPDGGDSLLTAAVRRLAKRLSLTPQQAAHCWLQAYCEQVLVPLFRIEADYGVALLAHQQNILVEMQQDLPVGMIYRDCQGSAFTASAQAWLEKYREADAENRFSAQQLLRYFPYYLLMNSTLAVTAALAAAGFDSETACNQRVRDALAALRQQVNDRTCLDFVLDSRYWQCKGNFFCYLHDHNENTIVDPAVIYFDFANPLYSGVK